MNFEHNKAHSGKNILCKTCFSICNEVIVIVFMSSACVCLGTALCLCGSEAGGSGLSACV